MYIAVQWGLYCVYGSVWFRNVVEIGTQKKCILQIIFTCYGTCILYILVLGTLRPVPTEPMCPRPSFLTGCGSESTVCRTGTVSAGRRLRRSDRTDMFVPSVKTDAIPERNSQSMTSGFGNSQRMTSGFGISH